MPGSITDQEVSPAAAREQVRVLSMLGGYCAVPPGSAAGQYVSPATIRKHSKLLLGARPCEHSCCLSADVGSSCCNSPSTASPQPTHLQWVADQEFIHNDGRVWDALPNAKTPCLIMNGDRDVLVSFRFVGNFEAPMVTSDSVTCSTCMCLVMDGGPQRAGEPIHEGRSLRMLPGCCQAR